MVVSNQSLAWGLFLFSKKYFSSTFIPIRTLPFFIPSILNFLINGFYPPIYIFVENKVYKYRTSVYI
jgi:hypothetical protein